MKRMNIPNHSDIQELSARIDALARELRGSRTAKAKPRTATKRAKPKA
jgi:outer membrane murein-binding lipoprotein Lpp